MTTKNLSKAEREAVAAELRANLPIADSVHGHVSPHRVTGYERYGKRAIDIVVSATALVITAPINALLAVGTFLDVGHPILFKQVRVGRDGAPFTLVKFRNMTNEVDDRGELLPPEQRVTKWGMFVRGTSLDELLNFWSVLKGDMSIIGPRPLLPEYTERYCEYHRARLDVRPGLECPPDPRLDDARGWEGHFNNDVWYAGNVSLKNDLKKFVRLVEAVFSKRGTAVRAAVARSEFMGYDEEGCAIGLDEACAKARSEELYPSPYELHCC